ncbi:hypothetical protein I79_023044 [Cricetulus griseus]|uniref:Uncharacterized protein n=1 Tax=Cricetulus griseus TaxID=10029 RepID=G3IGW7_CRIGR|nr:hypothetical protein I79_023044 [Cricetulus griseus]
MKGLWREQLNHNWKRKTPSGETAVGPGPSDFDRVRCPEAPIPLAAQGRPRSGKPGRACSKKH